MTSIALPRIKVKKRKRRPPNRREKMAIACFFFCGFAAVIGVVFILLVLQTRHLHGSREVAVSILIVTQLPNLWNLSRYWRVVLDYIRNGFEDD